MRSRPPGPRVSAPVPFPMADRCKGAGAGQPRSAVNPGPQPNTSPFFEHSCFLIGWPQAYQVLSFGPLGRLGHFLVFQRGGPHLVTPGLRHRDWLRAGSALLLSQGSMSTLLGVGEESC